MKNKLICLIPYLFVLVINYYLLPLIIKDTGSGILMMIFIMPLITFVCSVVYGIRKGFNLLFSLASVILFTPTIFIFYNKTAWIYIVAYGAITLVGNILGIIFHKTIK